MTVTIDIPALNRLCSWLEDRDKTDLLEAFEQEIVAKLKQAAQSGAPEPEFREVPAGEDHPWKDEAKAAEAGTAPEAGKGAQQPPKPETTGKPNAPETPVSAAAPVSLDAVQKAAAQMRNAGKLKAVTDLFPEYGIRKLSDLKGDQLQSFAGRLREMGAEL